ncbi:hypothetical protein ONZ45_g18569 [Pleurotus djamor]|nr:hypothetical protein ONZ45_g18569 [Pleurotus djamor]
MGKLTDLAAQKAIDDQIIHYESTILALKLRRNTYCAIAHIPDSIITYIFMYLHGDYLICDQNNSKMWHRVNLVCSHWRAVALASACLWSNIMVRTYDDPSHTANWMMEKMVRAATVPLSVRYDIYCPSAQTVDPCSSVVTQAIPSRSLHDLSITSKAFNHTKNILDTILKSGTQASKSLRILSIQSPAIAYVRIHVRADDTSLIPAINPSSLSVEYIQHLCTLAPRRPIDNPDD